MVISLQLWEHSQRVTNNILRISFLAVFPRSSLCVSFTSSLSSIRIIANTRKCICLALDATVPYTNVLRITHYCNVYSDKSNLFFLFLFFFFFSKVQPTGLEQVLIKRKTSFHLIVKTTSSCVPYDAVN